MADKCIWCNKKEGMLSNFQIEMADRLGFGREIQEYKVHEECRHELEGFVDNFNQYSRLFVILLAADLGFILFFLLLTVLLSRSLGLLGIGVMTIFLGATIFIFPFATPETIKIVGIKKAKFLTKGSSLAIVAVGIWIITLI